MNETIEAMAALEAMDTPEAADLFWSTFFDPEWELSDLEAIETLRARAGGPRQASGLLSIERATVISGDLIVAGDLDVNGHTLVLGDLRCSGYLFTGIHTCLIVTGAVEARAINALRSYWLVGGPIAAPLIWLGTYGMVLHRAAMRARLLVEEMELERHEDSGPVQAETRIVSDYVTDDEAALAQLAALLVPEAYRNDEGDVDAWELLRWASKGREVFKVPAAVG